MHSKLFYSLSLLNFGVSIFSLIVCSSVLLCYCLIWHYTKWNGFLTKIEEKLTLTLYSVALVICYVHQANYCDGSIYIAYTMNNVAAMLAGYNFVMLSKLPLEHRDLYNITNRQAENRYYLRNEITRWCLNCVYLVFVFRLLIRPLTAHQRPLLCSWLILYRCPEYILLLSVCLLLSWLNTYKMKPHRHLISGKVMITATLIGSILTYAENVSYLEYPIFIIYISCSAVYICVFFYHFLFEISDFIKFMKSRKSN